MHYSPVISRVIIYMDSSGYIAEAWPHSVCACASICVCVRMSQTGRQKQLLHLAEVIHTSHAFLIE